VRTAPETYLVLFGMQNRTFCPYLAAKLRIVIPVMGVAGNASVRPLTAMQADSDTNDGLPVSSVGMHVLHAMHAQQAASRWSRETDGRNTSRLYERNVPQKTSRLYERSDSLMSCIW
jgi:hypothetical protein